MSLRIDIRHETDIKEKAISPFFLKNIDRVGTDNKRDWCWAACAVMVMRYLKENWRQEQDYHKLLCDWVANIATRKCKRLADDGNCCSPFRCDTTIFAEDITLLWKNLLGHEPKPQQKSDFGNCDALSKALVYELKINEKPIEVGLNGGGREGHLVIIYGCDETEKSFYKLDPDGANGAMPACELYNQCNDLWFGLS